MELLTRLSRQFLTVAVLSGLLLLGFWTASVPFAAAQETTEVAAVDTTPPVVVQPGDITVAAVDAGGAVVAYSLPAANDDVDGPLTPLCTPASGALFPLGTTLVTCSATDFTGNVSNVVAFNITVRDQQGPFIEQPGSIALVASDATGMAVSYAVPAANDSISGPAAVGCMPGPGEWFGIGSTLVTCSATDASGNSSSVSFTVTLEAPAVPTEVPTEEPTDEPTVEPTETATPTEAVEPTETDVAVDPTEVATDPANDGDEEAAATETAIPTETASPTPSPTPSASPSPTPVTTPAALGLPWPPPPPANPIYGSGPIDGLSLIWGGYDFPISQEYGHTEFSLSQQTLYLYGIELGLDGRAHPGIDIGMPAGTYLYSPVAGTVIVSGGVPYYTYYGNGEPGVGELLIETDAGDQVVLGHMAAIAVGAGERVTTGQFVGLSGGDNGDHLHLETRAGGSYVVDPRQSFLVDAIAAYNASSGEAQAAADDSASSENAAAAPAETATGDTTTTGHDEPASQGVGVTSEPPPDDQAAVTESESLLDALIYESDSPYGDGKQTVIGELLETWSVTADEESNPG